MDDPYVAELKHAQWKQLQHMEWPIGVTDQIAQFVAFVVRIKHLEAKIHCFFSISTT